eukprot:jgi/Pico_ML_1/52869/g3510.t1
MEATHDHEHDHGGTSGNDLVDGHLAHGSWMGHALPGAFFLAWGTWWMIAITLNYNRSNLARKTYHSKTYFPLHCKWGLQGIEKLEARLKAILPAIGMFAEVYFHPKDIYFRSLFDPDGNIASENVNNWQHFTMYLFFSLSGLLDLFGEKLSLPPTFNQSFLALSFWIEAVLFLFHLKMQFGLMSTIHFLLVMAIIGCAIGCTSSRTSSTRAIPSTFGMGLACASWTLHHAKVAPNASLLATRMAVTCAWTLMRHRVRHLVPSHETALASTCRRDVDAVHGPW